MDFENRLDDLYTKCKKYRVYYKIFKHSQCLQCKYCDEYFKNDQFIAHSQTCTNEKPEQTKSQMLSDLKFSIIQTLIKEDDQSKKPFTEYVIQVKLEGKKWIITRRYKQFWSLHASLQKNYPNVEFPHSSSIFCNKTLSDIRKNAIVDGRRKMLQKYIADIVAIPVIRASRKLNQFLGLSDEQLDTEDSKLPKTSLDDIFERLNAKRAPNKKLLNLESLSARYFTYNLIS